MYHIIIWSSCSLLVSGHKHESGDEKEQRTKETKCPGNEEPRRQRTQERSEAGGEAGLSREMDNLLLQFQHKELDNLLLQFQHKELDNLLLQV